MLDGLTLDPQNLLIAIGVVVGGAALLYFLWGELRHRSRRFGGDDRAAAVMLGGVAVLLVSLWPNLLPMEIGLLVLFAALGAIYRPALVVKALGGPSIRWRALQAGRELQVIVAERGGPVAAADDTDVAERIAALVDLESPETRAYLAALRSVVVADPGAEGIDEKRARLADADASLRESLGARPTWERDLEQRLARATDDAGDAGDDADPREDPAAS